MRHSLRPLGEFWAYLPSTYRLRSLLIVSLMLVASVAELISIGAAMPFLLVLTNESDLPFTHVPFVTSILESFEGDSALVVSITFITIIIFSSLLRWTLLDINTRFSHDIGHFLGQKMYERVLYADYEVRLKENSAKVIDGITTKINIITNGVIHPLFTFCSSALIIVGALISLLIISPVTTGALLLILAIFYFTISLFVRRTLDKSGKDIAIESRRVLKCLQEGYGAVREILLGNSQGIFLKKFIVSDKQLRLAQTRSTLIANGPKFLLEPLAIIVIILSAYFFIIRGDGTVLTVSLLGTFALAAQRLLPLVQTMYSCYSTLRSAYPSFHESLVVLKDTVSSPAGSFGLNDSRDIIAAPITLEKVSFRYQAESNYVLRNVDLTIQVGKWMGISGESGCGKSTLVDILSGLLAPTGGHVFLGNEKITNGNRHLLRNQVAYVPQSIFLIDGTIEENIAFDRASSEIDNAFVKECIDIVGLFQTIKEFPHNLRTSVGERGVNLSGGQIQRVGIARALYRRPKLLILDEATTGLDPETQELVLNGIARYDNKLTVVLISHHASVLSRCDSILELSRGNPPLG